MSDMRLKISMKASVGFQSYLSSVLTLIFLILNLIFVRIQIEILGVDRYGMLVLLLSVFGMVGLLNMGIGTALIRFYSECRSVYWTIFAFIFVLIFCLAVILIFFGSFFYVKVFNVIGVKNEGLTVLSFWGLGLVGISRLMGNILTSYWIAKIDFFRFKLVSFINYNLPILLILLFVYYWNSLNFGIFFSGIANLLFVLTIFGYVLFSEVRNLKIKFPSNGIRRHMKFFLKEAIQFQILSIMNNVSTPLINVLINLFFGLHFVSYFDISLKFLRVTRQIIVSYVEPLFSQIIALHSKQKYKLIRFFVNKYTKRLLILSSFYVILILLFSKMILSLWIGRELASKVFLNIYILSFGFAINISSSALYYFFLAIPDYRKYVLYHQLVLFLLPILTFIIQDINFTQYLYVYSAAYIIASLYLFFIYLKLKIVKGRPI